MSHKNLTHKSWALPMSHKPYTVTHIQNWNHKNHRLYSQTTQPIQNPSSSLRHTHTSLYVLSPTLHTLAQQTYTHMHTLHLDKGVAVVVPETLAQLSGPARGPAVRCPSGRTCRCVSVSCIPGYRTVVVRQSCQTAVGEAVTLDYLCS